ncbi:MAG: glycosyltransferase family protein [Mongoliitalea sp.]
MKFLFLVQGEGRGHMTQAISFAEILNELGHELVAVGVGSSKRRRIPDFFMKGINCPILTFESPNFECDKDQKKIILSQTIFKNLGKLPTFFKSLQTIQKLIEEHQPDVILNFYELLGGLHQLIFRPSQKYWVIGHQYLIAHKAFPFAKGKPIQKFLFKANTQLTAIGAEKWLALSFRPLEPSENLKLTVLPPLLRKQLFELMSEEGDFILAYMVNQGYANELIAQAKKHPDLKIEAFWDNKSHPEAFQILPNLVFHPINDRLFLEKMSTCKAYISTAGFESICEAMYFQKPVLMIPVEGQYEQECNAIDAEIAGAGIAHKSFDLGVLKAYLSNQDNNNHAWVIQSRNTLVRLVFHPIETYAN